MDRVITSVPRLKMALVGSGAARIRHRAGLEAAGATKVTVFPEASGPSLVQVIGDRLGRRLLWAAVLVDGAVLPIAALADDVNIFRHKRMEEDDG